MAIYQEYIENGHIQVEYNFTYLDRVIDSYRNVRLRPFLELGFMPRKLARGQQTVFYWEGHVTPPKDYAAWNNLIQATLRHLCQRYGADEVVQWPVEVWNEPNLDVFWENADMVEYFQLFACTFRAVKEVDPRFRVGGPAICGVDDQRWIHEFLSFCHSKNIPLDFVTRHHYTTEPPERTGHYGYSKLHNPAANRKTLDATRSIVDSFPEFRGKEIHLTEFNTSYIPNCPLHDTNLNAAYIARMLSWLGDIHASYSYWTFGDVFEEQGVPFTPFHGGFGLVANGGIPKPTFWVFQFYKDLQGNCLAKTEEAVVTCRDGGGFRAICWNLCMEGSDRELELTLEFPAADGGMYCILERLVDEEVCNPLKVWHDFGEPASLSEPQIKLLRECARPLTTSRQAQSQNGSLSVTIVLKRNAVVSLEVFPVSQLPDRGYSYDRAIH